jgi:hypothetical protein
MFPYTGLREYCIACANVFNARVLLVTVSDLDMVSDKHVRSYIPEHVLLRRAPLASGGAN